MQSKFLGILLVFSLLAFSFQPAFSQSNNWENVRTLTGIQVAVQTASGEILFGRIREANNLEIGLQIAGAKEYQPNDTKISKNEIRKVWLADLRFGERNMGKGALIGLGVGAGLGAGYFIANKNKSSTASVAIPFSALYGAGIGTVIGYFAKKGHKKGKLVYDV